MSTSLLSSFDLDLPVVAAPMAGGPTTADLVIAAGQVGSLGFLAGGYQRVEALAEQVAIVRAAGRPFGVNLFAPNPDPVDRDAFVRYAALIRPEAERLGVDLPDRQPLEDNDGWAEKVELLVQQPVPFVSFTFGLPPADTVRALRAVGSVLLQTVTSPDEARAAADAGMDVLVVQGSAAGGHYGTFTPRRAVDQPPLPDLVSTIREATGVPVVAAGGVGTAEDVAELMAAGADAVAVGTVLLRADEAGTNATHRAALADPRRDTTVMTHAFTGRPARALRNDFTERYDDVAPFGYPALHHLTSPMRKAAAAAGDPDRLHLWAGTGFPHATDEPVAVILERLARLV